MENNDQMVAFNLWLSRRIEYVSTATQKLTSRNGGARKHLLSALVTVQYIKIVFLSYDKNILMQLPLVKYLTFM